MKVVSNNRKARFEYDVIQTLEAGIELKGTEVKSIRAGQVNIGDSHCRVSSDMQVYLINTHITPYEFGNIHNHDPKRERKLLLHKSEIRRLYGQSREKGLTMIPLKLFLKNGKVKVQLALVKGKKIIYSY